MKTTGHVWKLLRSGYGDKMKGKKKKKHIMIFRVSCHLRATITDPAAKMLTSNWCSLGNSHTTGIKYPKPLRHVTHQNTRKPLWGMQPQSLCVKSSLSHLRLTKGPDYFPGWDISQSVAHYCNGVLQGVSLGNVSGNDRRAIHSGIDPNPENFLDHNLAPCQNKTCSCLPQ